MRWLLALPLALAGCTATTTSRPPPAGSAPKVTLPADAVAPPATAPPAEGYGLKVINATELDIDLYMGFLVDAAGELGTRLLWPHRFDCEARERVKRIVPAGGERWLPAPTRVYTPGACEPGPPLPPGDYVVRLDSGYGDTLYAAAAVTLPLRASATLRLEKREGPAPCTDALARRATRLVAGGAWPGLRDPRVLADALDGCELAAASCGATLEPPELPPARCTITLHMHEYGALLRVARPPGRDALRGLTAELDREIVFSREPAIDRTSSSAVALGGRTLVVAGTSSSHIHEHGGDAARIGSVTLHVQNPLERSVSFRVLELEYLVDYSCGLPAEVRARPRVVQVVPSGRLPPGRSSLEIIFEPQDAYQAHCDRFATRVRLEVEGHELPVTSEHNVSRFDPIQ